MNKNVVIGKPLVAIESIYEDESVDLFTDETFLPNILVEIGFFKSKSEIRKNRPDLLISLDSPDFLHFRIGKKHLWLLIGIVN